MGRRARRAMDRVFAQKFVPDQARDSGNGWLFEIEAGRAGIADAAAAHSQGIAPVREQPEPGYAAAAFEADSLAALVGEASAPARLLAGTALSRGEHDRLLAAGVDPVLLANLTIAGDLGTARVDLSRDGSRFQVGGPDPRLLLGVRDAGFALIDVVAISSHDENRWSLMTGQADMLGAWYLERAHEAGAREVAFRLRVFSTPWDWVRGGGRGICVLEWCVSALAELRLLDGRFVTLVVDAGAREVLRAKLKHGGLPLVAEAEDLSRLSLAERLGRRAANG